MIGKQTQKNEIIYLTHTGSQLQSRIEKDEKKQKLNMRKKEHILKITE